MYLYYSHSLLTLVTCETIEQTACQSKFLERERERESERERDRFTALYIQNIGYISIVYFKSDVKIRHSEDRKSILHFRRSNTILILRA
jgi:hypothetical protein